MLKYLTSSLFIILALVLVPSHAEIANPVDSESANGIFLPQVVNFRQDATPSTVTLTLDANWTLFQFGNSGTNVSTKFIVNSANVTSLLITDLYWVGDSFSIYVNDSVIGSSCLVEPNTLMIAYDPTLAYLYGPWSGHCFVLPPGQSIITVGVNQSPFTGGAAAIQALSTLACPLSPRC